MWISLNFQTVKPILKKFIFVLDRDKKFVDLDRFVDNVNAADNVTLFC